MGDDRRELTILVPVLDRPHRIRPLLESIEETTPGAHVVFIDDAGDEIEAETLKKTLEDYKPGPFFGVGRFGSLRVTAMITSGNYAAKINSAVRYTTEPLLLFAADDLKFHPGWFEAAKAKLTEGIGVVATEDLCNGRVAQGLLATHPLVTRDYCARGTVDDPGKVLHEGYRHEYVDREFSETAIFRGAFAYAPDAIVEHLHPMVGKAPMDRLYHGQLRRMRQGRRVYGRRRHMWTSRSS